MIKLLKMLRLKVLLKSSDYCRPEAQPCPKVIPEKIPEEEEEEDLQWVSKVGF